MMKYRFILFTLFAFCFCYSKVTMALLQPPVGSVCSSDLTACFTFFESPEEQKHAFGVTYEDDEIHIKDSFPGDSVWMYYKLRQSNPEDGFLIIKTVRKYKYPVSDKAKGKVNVIYNDGFYKKTGFLENKWNKQSIGKNIYKKFSIDQFKGFVEDKSVGKGIESFLDFYWGKSKNSNINSSSVREYFAFDEYSNSKYKLYSCRLYHHLPFNGNRYVEAKIPMAEQNNNLESVYIEVVEIRGGGFKKIKRYWLKEN